MSIFTIVNIQTGEVMYYLISMADWVYPGEGRGVTGKRPLAHVLDGKVMVDSKSFDNIDLVLDVGKPQRGDLLAQGLFTRR